MGNMYDIFLERLCLMIDVCCLFFRDDCEGRMFCFWWLVDDVGYYLMCLN